MLRYVRWQIESRLRQEIEFNWIEGAKLIVRNGMAGATGNIYCGLHEFADMALLLHLLRPGDLFVDVGANVGSYTVLASAVCGSDAIAVEPDPETMRALKKNIVANRIGDRVTTIQAALGSEAGTANFSIGLDTTNKIVSRKSGATRKVIIRCLDDVMEGLNPTLIKLDVEGHEAEVLRGGKRTLSNPSLMAIETETSDTIVSKQLVDSGFTRWIYDPHERRFTIYSSAHIVAHSSNALFLRDTDTCQSRVKAAPRRLVFGHLL